MFDWFKKKEKRIGVFDDNPSAFRFACETSKHPFLIESVIPALVIDIGKSGPDGERFFLIKLATQDGGKDIWGCTLKEAEAFPSVGDFVGFRVVRIASELPEDMSLIGYIAMRLEPVHVEGDGWKVAESFTPVGIKPTIRW